LRIWAESPTGERIYRVRLSDPLYSTAVEGTYESAWTEFELSGTITSGDYIGLSWLTEHHTLPVYYDDTLESLAARMTADVNTSTTMMAALTGRRIRLTRSGNSGANGNRMGVYSYVAGSKTEAWDAPWRVLSGGTSPTKWRFVIDFANLRDSLSGELIPTNKIRKMRWTYAADYQPGAFQRSEFQVVVSNWTVTGSNRAYSVAGPSSRRIEDDAPEVTYSSGWTESKGNFSGGSIHSSAAPGRSLTCRYQASGNHSVYLGSRLAAGGAQVNVSVDGGPAVSRNLAVIDEDVLVRLPLADLGPGSHTVSITHSSGGYFYFDFVELAVKTTALPVCPADTKMTLATDWDTDHSIALPAERTAWMLHSLGFRGRANHYVGALWFYELARPGHQYASGTIDFTGTPEFSQMTEIQIGRADEPPGSELRIQHMNLIADTAEIIAKAFELEINRGYTAIRAEASGARLTIYARAMGSEGEQVTLAASPATGAFRADISGVRTLADGRTALDGSGDVPWRTDLTALPRINRACRDWTRSYFTALAGYGLDCAIAFSMELQHGDPDPAVGIAQRYPSGAPVTLTTPALQTNFSPVSRAFWEQVYLDAAKLMSDGGLQPFLQFGEVQWWYFPYDGSGLPFYDDYTKDRFRTAYGRELQTIPSHTANPTLYPEEMQFLPLLIGEFTAAVIAFVRASYPACRFEVLYPPDVNETALNTLVNYPLAHWTPATLACLKTESFTYTYERNLDSSLASMNRSKTLGFPAAARSHLVGISDASTAWVKEAGLAKSQNVESVVLFALDQFALIGYPVPVEQQLRRSVYLG
jgi:hypothetical protein